MFIQQEDAKCDTCGETIILVTGEFSQTLISLGVRDPRRIGEFRPNVWSPRCDLTHLDWFGRGYYVIGLRKPQTPVDLSHKIADN